MVMQKNIMRKNLRQSIFKSLGRYIAIVAIIALGAGMFVGLRTTRSDMIATCQLFTDQQNMFDLRLISTYGWSQNQLDSVKNLDGILDAEGIVTIDAMLNRESSEEDSVYRIFAIPERVNLPYLVSGRMPESADECVVDARRFSNKMIGTKLYVSSSNDEDTLKTLKNEYYTIVGRVNSPLYMNMDRGTTSVGNGSISAFLYIPGEGLNVDYYTQIDVTIPGNFAVYSDEYDDTMDEFADFLKDALKPFAEARYTEVLEDAEEQYADGLVQLKDGKNEYQENWDKAISEFAKAKKQLEDGEKEIAENRQKLEDGEKQIEEGQKSIDEGRKMIVDSRNLLSENKTSVYEQLSKANQELLDNYRTVLTSLRQVENGIVQLDSGIYQMDTGISQLESGLNQIDSAISQLDILISVMDISISSAQTLLDQAKDLMDEERAAELQAQLDSLNATKEDYLQQKNELERSKLEYSGQLADLKSQRASLAKQRDELISNRETLNDALDKINIGFMEAQNGQTEADIQFSMAEDKIAASTLQLDEAQRELDSRKQELEEGKIALSEAEAELENGWEEYHTSYKEAMDEFADARREIQDAEKELQEAREKIDSMSDPSVYVMTRNTNVGYVTFESNADIVAGVSRVFPAFFLLVAAMVCITTMTRMVDDERTQIGTLKALGYSNWEVASKYLTYAGSAAVIGCGLGVIAGSIAFPMVLWKAYCIMLNVTDWVVLQFDWPLCFAVLVSYTVVTLLVTWYSCRQETKDVPAELIRPKPPAAGKKVIFEKMAFWNHISFLNKVSIRNIFRYRQRLAMMLLGIGGCTALLVTGYGIRDSIVDVVNVQFQNVTKYDIAVTFSKNQTEDNQASFREKTGKEVDSIIYCNQSSMEIDFGGKTKEVNFLSPDGDLAGFVDLHSGKTKIAMPEPGYALVSIGAADILGISVGDQIVVRDPNMKMLDVTVSGIFDNNVYNYIIVSPETVESQWGERPSMQTAFLKTKENRDPHETGAFVSTLNDVVNVTVNKDMAKSVGSMMEAMDLVIVTVVVCAGLLAFIVLYNLTNINITERVREIATIKVLGFNAVETAAYVFKENLVLSAMGAILGLGLGKLLHTFVMSQIKIDMVWFDNRITALSYLISVILTMLAACIVALVFYFRLEKINMAEALKSVE